MPSWKKVITSGSNAAFNSLTVSSTITGSISGSLTGSLLGTASWAYSASQALTASYALNAGGSGFPFSGSAIITGSLLVSQSGITVTGSVSSTGGFTGSLFGTSSWAESASNAITASWAESASNATTASYMPLPYQTYTAIFTSVSSTTPVYTVLQNTLGDDLNWTNSGPNSSIKLTAVNNPQLFSNKQVYWNIHIVKNNRNPGVGYVINNSTDAVQIYPYDLSGNLIFNLGDSDTNLYCTLEIKVFPS